MRNPRLLKIFPKHFLLIQVVALLLMPIVSPGICPAGGGSGFWTDNQANLGQTPEQKEWDVKLGAGLRVGPRYEGSDFYTPSPVPYFNVNWRDIVSLGVGGLNVNFLPGRNYQFGVGLTYNPGRDEKGDSFFGTGLFGTDDRLVGLGDIDAALGVRVFGAYKLGPVAFHGSLVKYTGDQNDGILFNLGMGVPFHPTPNLILTPGIGATWATDSYMQTFFGVTAQQASRTAFPTFNAEGGLKDVTAGLNATYLLDRHWFISTDAGIKRLMGDADKSPITESGTSATVGSVVGYHF